MISELAMRIMKKSLVYSLTFLFLFSHAETLYAETDTTELHIRASVPPLVIYNIISENQYLDISKSDIRKGYEEVRSGTIMSIKTNTQDGYLISIHLLASEAYISVTVQFDDDGRLFELLPGSNIDIHMPSSSIEKENIRLNYLFYLSDTVKKAKYPWPIRASASLI